MRRLGLRARLVAAFVGIAVLASIVAALLTSVGLHSSFDSYLEQRTADAAASARVIAETTFADEGRWTPDGLDLLAHELVLTGYDFRLVADGRVLLDTTKLERLGKTFRRVKSEPVRGPDGRSVGRLELYALGPSGNMPSDDSLRSELDRAHLLAAGLAALVAILVGLFVAGRLAGPLRRLAQTARGLADGGPAPLPAGGSPEVRELGEALSGLSEDLERQRRARRQLAQDLSHELRTPLMILQSRIEAMQDGVLPFDADGLEALHAQALRLSTLIGQIERLAEAEAHPSPLRRDPVDLCELAREAHASLRPAFELRDLPLELDTQPATARGDADAVRQIIANLLSNALKYAPGGTAVVLETGREGDRSYVAVRDDGHALDSPEAARVFDRFYRGPGAAERGSGAGLGLTIAKDLANAQGGDVELTTEGAGTRFTLWLPALPLSHPPGQDPVSALRARAAGGVASVARLGHGPSRGAGE
ncbi:MAG TPA: HAMP domain-containing sensor histidine kinase [Miltoncostaeaceae bacterium]|nr:HAMP domain-containing sensor histidine kinase [Miltoncostaeaceae bacterium]